MTKLRIYHIQNSEISNYFPVKDINHAKAIIDNLAQSDLLNDNVEMNVFGLEQFNEETKDWEEWYDEDGCDIDEHFEMEN